MNKSQLRRLALEFAHGNLEHEEYRARRGRLLDGIEAGDTVIEREAPLEHEPTVPSAFRAAEPEAAATPEPAAPAPAERGLLSPLHVGVGAGALVLVAALLFWLFAGGESAPPPATTTSTGGTSAAPPAPAVPPARDLVETFVAEKDFSDTNLTRFRERWTALQPGEVDAARGTPWFRRMVTAVVQEVKTQKALADLDGTGNSLEKAHRLVAFGRFLGISEGMLPDVSERAALVEMPVQTAAAAATAGPAAAPEPRRQAERKLPTPVAAPLATVPETLAALPPPSAAAPEPTGATPTPLPPTPPAPRGREWLQSQPADAYTLQLFALNHLEKVERLIARHPELQLRLVDYSPDEPRYRVFLGRYATPAAARAAHAALPEDVRRDQPTPFVRPIGELVQAWRGDAPAAATAPAPQPARTLATAGPAPAMPSSLWLREQPSERYTLQVFASNSRDNAERLIGRFPDLALALHESSDADARFRVLYGSFASAEEARRAFVSLPGPLSTNAGLPLVKSIGELQQSAVGSSAN